MKNKNVNKNVKKHEKQPKKGIFAHLLVNIKDDL